MTLGEKSEKFVAKYLEQQGYRILERNFRSRFGEIDIIAERDGVTYFVEVRARKLAFSADLERIAASVDRKKLMKIKATAQAYISRSGHDDKDFGILVAAVNWYNPKRAKVMLVDVE